MDAKNVTLGIMAAVRQRVGCKVALYVQEDMHHTAEDGVRRYLPVVAVKGGGYDPIPADWRDQVSRHFGGLLPVAELRVEQINREFGLEPDDAAEVVRSSFNADYP